MDIIRAKLTIELKRTYSMNDAQLEEMAELLDAYLDNVYVFACQQARQMLGENYHKVIVSLE
jgi:maleate cis-trans isomerase